MSETMLHNPNEQLGEKSEKGDKLRRAGRRVLAIMRIKRPEAPTLAEAQPNKPAKPYDFEWQEPRSNAGEVRIDVDENGMPVIPEASSHEKAPYTFDWKEPASTGKEEVYVQTDRVYGYSPQNDPNVLGSDEFHRIEDKKSANQKGDVDEDQAELDETEEQTVDPRLQTYAHSPARKQYEKAGLGPRNRSDSTGPGKRSSKAAGEYTGDLIR